MRSLLHIILFTLVTLPSWARAKKPATAMRSNTKPGVAYTQVPGLTKAIMKLGIQPPNKHHITLKRAKRLAALFEHYGKKWGVDPWLAVSIARQESHFTDRPKRVKRCKTVIEGDSAVRKCWSIWAGEQGLMQVVPKYSAGAFKACTGRNWKYAREFRPTEIGVCTGMWLMGYRRDKVRRKMRIGKWFLMRGGRWSATRLFAPCGYSQKRFCRNGNRAACKRLWWVGSYNWGTHRVFCRRRKGIDPAGYPIRVIDRYMRIKKKFGTMKAVMKAVHSIKIVKGPKA